LYNPYVLFVRNPIIKLLLSPFFMSEVFVSDRSYAYDFVLFTKTVSHSIWQRYEEKFQKPLIQFPDRDIQIAKETLSKYIPINKKFVVLHVRDNGFYQDPNRTTRNADINTYQDAILHLIKEGYAVIRIGDAQMVRIDNMIEVCGPMLFDYAHSDIKSEIMDCFLISHCDFFIGLASGPAQVPMLFGVNSCNINWYNASNAPNFLKGDITSFKKFRYKSDNTLVPLDKIMSTPYSLNPSQDMLDQVNSYIENNSAEEIKNTVVEFLEKRHLPPSQLQIEAKKKILQSNYAYGANGNFSETLLNEYKI